LGPTIPRAWRTSLHLLSFIIGFSPPDSLFSGLLGRYRKPDEVRNDVVIPPSDPLLKALPLASRFVGVFLPLFLSAARTYFEEKVTLQLEAILSLFPLLLKALSPQPFFPPLSKSPFDAVCFFSL